MVIWCGARPVEPARVEDLDGEEAAEDVLRDADTALYRAKEEGRGCFRLFSDDLHASAMVRWQTETDLRRAITENQLGLQYQPIVDLETGALDSFEALVRWHHPARGLVPPSDFIPLAEETGLIVPLGQWVLDEACHQLARWRKASPQAARLAVAVNVACRQLIRPTFAAEVMATLEQTGLDPGALKIEVTESSMMDRAAVDTCMRLRDLGVALHLDDFGTGYSSLSYLHRMPVHAPPTPRRPRRLHGLLQHRTAVASRRRPGCALDSAHHPVLAVTSRLAEQPRLADSEHFAILVLHAGCQLAVLLSDYAQAVMKENIDLDDDAPS